jgi:tetratricopeptide (TPR) repeat protein
MESSDAKPNVALKLYYEDGTIRRVTLSREVIASYDAVLESLQKFYNGDVFHPELKLQYVDTEGDKCTISSAMEWECFLAQLTPDEVLKLHVSEGVHQGRYFKDGPPPEVTSIYVKEEKAEKRDIPIETKPDLAFSVPQCLQRLFKGEKILPYHLPSWLQPFAQIKKVPGTVNDVDLDIDVYGLFEELHRQAYKLLGQESKPEHVEKAKDFLESMLTIVPDHPLALYNLACAEARLGHTDVAMKALTRAVEQGRYTDAEHMQADPDLDNLRGLPEYQALIARITSANQPVQQQEEIVEAKVEEPAVPSSPETIEQSSTKDDDFVIIEAEVKEEAQLAVVEPVQIKIEEKPQEEDDLATFPYPAELRQLLDMGFELGRCKAQLVARKGNLDQTLNDLI